MRKSRWLLHAAVSACTVAACGGGGSGPDPVGSVAGTVRNARTEELLTGATVSVGSIETTTGADGRFSLADVTAGQPMTIRSQRQGFETYSAAITVAEGSNTHDIAMTRQSLFEAGDFAVYVSPDVSTVRGVILGLGGFDTRGYATDEFDNPDSTLNRSQRLTRQAFLGLASLHGLALMGSLPLSDESAADAGVLAALDATAVASDRPEVAQAPLFIWGISSAVPEAYGFTLRKPDRVIGFTAIIGATPSAVTSAAAQRVPGYVLLAERDAVVDNGALTRFFETNRAQGALWSFAVEPGAFHDPISSGARSLLVNWIHTVVQLRLPPAVTPGAPVVLRGIEETSGWLGHRTSFAIAPYADYADEKRDASWLPSQGNAQGWQRFVDPPAAE